jgi:outer membrane lipoprotein carrier protein
MVHLYFMMLFWTPLFSAEPGAGKVKPELAKPAPSMTPEVKALVDRMQAFYEKTEDFTADFRQDYTYKAFNRTQTSSGTVAYAKAKYDAGHKTVEPTRMRWEYEKPGKKTFLLTGEKVYFLDPEAATLTIGSIATNQLSASVTFLWGQGRLAEEFAITKSACAKCSGVQLQLDPLKPDPRFQRIFLEIDPKTATVIKSTVIDPDGSSNAITFANLKTNVGLASKDGGVPEAFKISPPPGTQVVDTTKLKQTP